MSKPPSNHHQSRNNPGRMQISMNDIDKATDDNIPSTSPPLPGLAQSSSNSSSSPPEPSTPPPHTHITSRSRTRNRYPNDLGRVPLHRRGTSKTYEALEDLLKEAGYKETRIFTPETERSEGGRGAEDSAAGRQGEDSRLSVVKDGMEAVVGFFAGLLPSAASSKTSLVSSASTLEASNGNGSSGNGTTSESATAQPEPLTASPQEYSPPASPSPLSGSGVQRYPNMYSSVNSGSRQGQPGAGRRSFDMTEPPTPTSAISSNLTSSVDSLNRLGDPTPKAVRSSRPSSASASAAASAFHSHTHSPYPHHSHHPRMPTTTGKSPVPRTPSLLSADHPYSNAMQRPSSRNSMSRPGSSQGQYRGQVPTQAQGPSGSTSGIPHLPQSSHSHSSHSSSHSRQNHNHTPTPLTQSNLSQHHQHQHQHHQAHPQHLHQHHSHLPHHPHHNTTQIASPHPSRASAYLRHVASIPTIPAAPTSRPSSTPVNFFSSKFSSLTRRSGRQLNVSLNDKPGDSEDEDAPPSVYYRSGTGEEEERAPHRLHPMPPSWLETVARAVLFGGGSVGGPAAATAAPHSPSASASAATRTVHAHLQHPHTRVQALRPTRSSLSQASRASHASQYSRRSARSQLSDSTNFTGTNTSSVFLAPPPAHIPLALHPPALFAKLERGRAGRSESEVFKTRVICRSAPGSRSGSVVRGTSLVRGGGENKSGTLNLNLGLTSANKNKRRRKEGKGEEVPSLARTRAEGDILWSSESSSRRKARKTRSRRMRSDEPSSPLRNAESDAHTDEDASDLDDGHSDASDGDAIDDEEDEEEEGELDLARILVPPKRQNSIKSLRKHLVGGAARPARSASRSSGAGGVGAEGASPVPPVPPLPATLSQGPNNIGGTPASRDSGGGRLTPNTPYRKPFRTTSLQSSEWDDLNQGHDPERDFDSEAWGLRRGGGKGSEDDDEHERHRASLVGY